MTHLLLYRTANQYKVGMGLRLGYSRADLSQVSIKFTPIKGWYHMHTQLEVLDI